MKLEISNYVMCLVDPIQTKKLEQMESYIIQDFTAAMDPLDAFLEAVGLSKFLGCDSESLVDAKNVEIYEGLTDDGILGLISPVLAVSDRLADPVLRREATFFDKMARLGRAMSIGIQWEEAAKGSLDSMCLTPQSKAIVQSCLHAMDDMNTVVAAIVKDAPDKTNVSHAVKDNGEVCIHPDRFDNYSYTELVSIMRKWSQAFTGRIGGIWTALIDGLVACIQTKLIEWEPYKDELLLPAQAGFVEQILKHEGYKHLAPLTKRLGDIVKLARDLDGMVPSEKVHVADKTCRDALKLVSLTFCLYHIKVTWPKVKGWRNQEAEREKLEKNISESSFSESWSCLPAPVQKYIKDFGARVAS